MNYGIATQAEAEAGTSNVKYMTPYLSRYARVNKTAGTKVLFSDLSAYNTSDSDTLTLKLAYTIGVQGTLRISFQGRGLNTTLAQQAIYRNGVRVGTIRSLANNVYTTYTEDISGWNVGDTLEFYAQKPSGIKDIKIMASDNTGYFGPTYYANL